MGKEYILTITAANRIGILAAVSNAIAELSGDIRELSVTVIGRFFTIILSAEFPEDREPGVVVDHLRDIGRPYGLEVVLKDPSLETFHQETEEGTATYYLTLGGTNQPGMMRRISARLAQENIDISHLYAVCDNGAFKMIIQVAVPPSADLDALKRSLETLNEAVPTSVQLQTAAEFEVTGSARPLRTQFQTKRDVD
jgi:glycine cleavage system transcriptional repressor